MYSSFFYGTWFLLKKKTAQAATRANKIHSYDKLKHSSTDSNVALGRTADIQDIQAHIAPKITVARKKKGMYSFSLYRQTAYCNHMHWLKLCTIYYNRKIKKKAMKKGLFASAVAASHITGRHLLLIFGRVNRSGDWDGCCTSRTTRSSIGITAHSNLVYPLLFFGSITAVGKWCWW